eukprot:4381168-Pleurochrysis_carterae.AAC.2
MWCLPSCAQAAPEHAEREVTIQQVATQSGCCPPPFTRRRLLMPGRRELSAWRTRHFLELALIYVKSPDAFSTAAQESVQQTPVNDQASVSSTMPASTQRSHSRVSGCLLLRCQRRDATVLGRRNGLAFKSTRMAIRGKRLGAWGFVR